MSEDPSVEQRLAVLESQLRHAQDRIDALELRTAGMGTHAPRPPADPNLDALKRAMTTMFKTVTGADYVFDGAKDGAAVKRLVTISKPLLPTPMDAVLARWRTCLLMQRFPATRSIAVFASRFNEFVPAAPRHEPPKPQATGVADPYANRGRARW